MRPSAQRSAAEAIQSAPASPPPRFPLPAACFLLHGNSGNRSSWPNHMDLEALASEYNLAFICPSLGRSFGLNWVHGLPWSDFWVEELPLLIGEHLRVDTSPSRALAAGFSAGGYAAFHGALTRPGRFRAAGSFSGVLDMASTRNRTRRQELYDNAFATAEIAGTDADLMALAQAVSASGTQATPLWAACGSEDPLLEQNRVFRDHAHQLHYPLEYQEWEGTHSWPFWTEALRRFLSWVNAA